MPKKGEDNLIPLNQRTKEEQREIAKKGGQASGVARRKKRDFKSAVRMILDLPAAADIEDILKRNGVPEEDHTNRVAVVLRMFSKAMTGDVNAARFLSEMSGETPAQKFAEKQYHDKQKSPKTEKDEAIAKLEEVLEEIKSGF